MPNSPLTYSTFHASELCPYNVNDPLLFPACELSQLGPVITKDGQEEWLVDGIIDERRWGGSWQYLVSFMGYGTNHNCWMAQHKLLDNEVLDCWESRDVQ